MSLETSVLVLAPVGRDGDLLVQALAKAGVEAVKAPEFAAILQAARTGDAGALVMTAEALSLAKVRELTHALEVQPHWSDLPVLLLVPGGKESAVTRSMELELRSLPNATLLERPIRPETLASSTRAALKSRARQYEVKRVIEERDRTFTSLIESEKLAAVGRLAASISHEINNPLEAITNLLYLVQQDETLCSQTRTFLQIADEELVRASHITQQSLRFHRQATRPRPISTRELLAPVLAIYNGRFANSEVTVETEFRDEAEVVCYEGEIRQVLSNLIGNAVDAMRTGGRLRLRSRRAARAGTGEPGLSVLIADTGHGMTPETAERIFDAFYTTKGIGGTGLGLWISADIVRKHRGRLQVRSSTAPGRTGTVFRLFLPLKSPGPLQND